ncbi:PoNi-like cognate immunity protein [Pseudomonas sp. LjRoot277]|uniref:PoNe immunity protein domain-containing protein n=1 Tax=Pseudomonas sp. LjRoot277 TaxID=3342307 RepID=UPI003ECF4107
MKKRQQFITQSYYKTLVEFYDASEVYWASHGIEEDFPGQEASLKAYEIKQDSLEALIIRYTAGEPVEALIKPLEKVVVAFEAYQRALASYEGITNISPLNLDESPSDYEEFVQILSLCILLHRNDLLARFVLLTDAAGFDGEDTLYEDLLRKALPGRVDIDEWFHPVYTLLIRSIYAENKDEASKLLNEYCSQWYSSFGELQTSWHDTHLSIDGDDGSYFGYWAFEAAAIAFLYEVDDSRVDHLIYPRDLVEYARNYTGSTAVQMDHSENKAI